MSFSLTGAIFSLRELWLPCSRVFIFTAMVSQCKPRKIYQYHKGDMTALKSDLKNFQDTLLAKCDGKSVEELWLSFHSQIMTLQEKHIPSKKRKPQTSMPWINKDLKKKIRRNNRLFKLRKKRQKHRSNFLKNRRNLQKQIKQARWDHINVPSLKNTTRHGKNSGDRPM